MKAYQLQKISNFENWETIPAITDFTYPWREEPVLPTSFQAYYDQTHLHFRYVAHGPKPLIYVKDNNKLEVIHSERVELFFTTNEKMAPYYVLEMDPNGRVLDYRANFYRKFERDWQWPESLHLQTAIHKGYYTLEGKIRFDTLRQLGAFHGDHLKAGVYRGHCAHLENGKSSIKWMTWIDPQTPEPDFHVPESFGKFLL